MPFLTELKVQPITGTYKRRLISNFIYNDYLFGNIVAPSGFISNYASIPEIIPQWIIDSDSPIIRDISIIHDFTYSNLCLLDISRKQADEVLCRGMRELGAGYIISKIVYYSVRTCGKYNWKND